VSAKLNGLKPGKYSLFVHAFGDFSQGCSSAGPQFNPRGDSYKPGDGRRGFGHITDFEVNEEAEVSVDTKEGVISLTGPESIIGRSVLVLTVPEEPAAAENEESTAGDGGGDDSTTPPSVEVEGQRMAGGVIGIARMVVNE